METFFSFQCKNIRLQIVRNDKSMCYQVHENRKIIYESSNIYWCKRAFVTRVVYNLLGILYDANNEYSIYEGQGKKLFRFLSGEEKC